MDIRKPKPKTASSSAAARRSKPQVKHSAKPQARPRSSTRATTRKPKSLITDDISASLQAIDSDSKLGVKTKRKNRIGRKNKKPWSKKRKIITWSIVGVVLIIAMILGYYAFRIASNSSSMFSGSIFDAILRKDELQKDENGRSNILIFGTSEDNEGHSGALLADSIMLLSVDQETKEAYTVSIPRDLWVDYDTPCSVGSSGKINATYYCGLEASNQDKDKAGLAFAKKVSAVVGSDVQYYVAVNYTVVRSLVDSLGGVDVTIASKDPRGISDRATGLQLSNGQHSIDGETALDLSRARNAKGGYGLPRGNFDREQHQQLVLKAIQKKAVSSGTLTDLNKVVAMSESLGTNIRTNVKGSELRTALEVAGGIQSSEIESKVLNDPKNPLVMTGGHNGQSIVRPIKALTDYSDIHEFLRPNVSS